MYTLRSGPVEEVLGGAVLFGTLRGMKKSDQNRSLDAVDVRDRARDLVLVWIRAGYTLGAIAEVLDVSKSAVHRWKEGDRPVRRLATEIVREGSAYEAALAHNAEAS